MLNNNLILTWPVISEVYVEHRYRVYFVLIPKGWSAPHTQAVTNSHGGSASFKQTNTASGRTLNILYKGSCCSFEHLLSATC